ncbi:MAG: hypothetical protein BWK80_54805 [Desulfobacteraceae bacterium IS3]|nr:MAG: hypothetical protein BWK80_54805 [Desulfobacteraceae bacterium IS3]
MSLQHDFNEPLVEEFLTDLADSFFGTRRELEHLTEVFFSYIEILRKREKEVEEKAGFLNYLLLDAKLSPDFYRSIHLDAPDMLSEIKFSDEILPKKFSLALTAKSEFVKLVLYAYDLLQKASDEYNNGKGDCKFAEDDEEAEKGDVYYKLVVNMCNVINEKVKKVNTDMAPSCVLQFVKKFDSGDESTENITGTVFSRYDSSLDKKFAYCLIDFDSLKLKVFPELPSKMKAEPEITAFCKRVWSDNREDIKKRISELKQKINIIEKN